MDSHLVINICCMLGGMLAALCWLKRGRNEYMRYAMILLPYGPGSSVHGISHERILEWVAISFSRGFS